jgi:hypothetical protein
MPPNVKLGLSVIVAAVSAAAVWWFADASKPICEYAALFLGAFMIVSMWIFPEVSRGGGARDVGSRR